MNKYQQEHSLFTCVILQTKLCEPVRPEAARYDAGLIVPHDMEAGSLADRPLQLHVNVGRTETDGLDPLGGHGHPLVQLPQQQQLLTTTTTITYRMN